MGNTFGRMFRVTTAGESYSGGFRKNLNIPKELFGGLISIVDGVPAGIKITAEDIQQNWTKGNPDKLLLIHQGWKRIRYIFFQE